MSKANPKYSFRTVFAWLGAISVGLTIALGVTQVGTWVNRHAVWILWVAICLLSVAISLLAARLEAEKKKPPVVREVEVINEVMVEMKPKFHELSPIDGTLASDIHTAIVGSSLLATTADFFAYQIPRPAVSAMYELSRMPRLRAAHDDILRTHMEAVGKKCDEWISKFTLISGVLDEGHYTTKPEESLPGKVMQKKLEQVDELTDMTNELHELLLRYERFYASVVLN